VPAIEAVKMAFRLLDLTGFLFAGMSEKRWLLSGTRVRRLPLDATGTVEAGWCLHARLEELARGPGERVRQGDRGAVLVRYGEVLRGPAT
jgi:hypothetical protein